MRTDALEQKTTKTTKTIKHNNNMIKEMKSINKET
jgi:hypothetical protein